jgi:hypothetical protein
VACTDAELLSIAVVRHMLGRRGESGFLAEVARDWGHLFPGRVRAAAGRLAQDGLDLIEGEAHFTGPKTVQIALRDGGTREISAPVIVIDAGTRPRPLAITGAGDVPVLDSTSIMELDELPERLIILGGGYIGLEFGQMFRRSGSEVTIIQSAACLMMIEDEDLLQLRRDMGLRPRPRRDSHAGRPAGDIGRRPLPGWPGAAES